MLMKTTIAVSTDVVLILGNLKKQFNSKSMDECIRVLIARDATKNDLFGCDKGRIDTKGVRDEHDRSF